MIFPPILQLTVLGLYDAGVPNSERIILRPTDTLNLAQYCIVLAHRPPQGESIIMLDNLFWFPNSDVSPPCWIVIMSGEGTNIIKTHETTGQPVHVFYWGRKATIFNAPGFIPIVVQVGAILVSGPVINKIPPSKPQKLS